MITFLLPFYSSTSGGIQHTIALAEQLGANIHFQRLIGEYPVINCKWTVGKIYPKGKIISYSDDPTFNGDYINMLSYGMSITQERRNAKKAKTVFCSTIKLEKLLKNDGITAHRIGFGLNLDHLVCRNKKRENWLAILYSSMEIKRYNDAVKIADNLFNKGVISGVVSFGDSHGYNTAKKPVGLVKHYENATREQISEVFNQCKCYIMPSISEGLNLTPLEATLCGCPAILYSGAIDEIYFHQDNCLVMNIQDFSKGVEYIIENYDDLSEKYMNSMIDIVKDYTWGKTANELKKWI